MSEATQAANSDAKRDVTWATVNENLSQARLAVAHGLSEAKTLDTGSFSLSPTEMDALRALSQARTALYNAQQKVQALF